MIKRGSIVLITLLAVVLWLSQIIWVPLVVDRIQSKYAPCQTTLSSNACDNIVSRAGSVGEMFGSIGSLFSGLALVGVAITLYIESRARRVGKKPLIVCFFTEDSIALDLPVMQEPKSIRLTANFKIANQGESAINVYANASLRIDGNNLSVGEKVVQMPLAHSAEVEVGLKKVLEGNFLEGLLVALNNASKDCLLDITMRCESLEGVSWTTEVSYTLKIMTSLDHARLQAIYRSEANADELWRSAAVAVRPDLLEGSWSYSQTKLFR